MKRSQRGLVRTIVSVLAAVIAATCFIAVVVIQRDVSRQDYIASCLHTNQAVHLLLDGPISAGVDADRKVLADPRSTPTDRATARSKLTAALGYQRLVDSKFANASCRWPPVSLVPALTSPTTKEP